MVSASNETTKFAINAVNRKYNGLTKGKWNKVYLQNKN